MSHRFIPPHHERSCALAAMMPALDVDPVVTKVLGDQKGKTKLVEICFKLADPDSAMVSVRLEVSADAGLTWNVPVASAGQSVWPAVAPGKDPN